MATRVSYPIFKAFTAAGTFGIGYKLYTYEAGTTTPLTVYQNEAGTVPHANPIILDAIGQAEIFITQAAKFTLTDAEGNVQTGWPVDNIDPTTVTAEEVAYTPSGSLTSDNVQEALDDVIEALDDVISDFNDVIPVGSVLTFPFSSIPSGFLECDGSAISRTTYSDLFAVISDDYGSGDGSTTFNIPDYRGQFMRGWAHGQTTDPDRASRTDRGDGTTGDNVGTKQADQLKSHSHTYYTNWSNGSTQVAQYSNSNGLWGLETTSSGGNETRPTNINVLFCIKY